MKSIVLLIYAIFFMLGTNTLSMAEPVIKKKTGTLDVFDVKTQKFNRLMLSAKTGDLPSLKLQLDKLSDINIQNKNGATLLMIAAKYGNKHIVKYLLINGADATIKNKKGLQASDFAKIYGHDEIVSLL